MINTERIFQLDESISILYNELKPIQNEITELIEKNDNDYNYYGNEKIASLVAKRDLINRKISGLQKQCEKEMEN